MKEGRMCQFTLLLLLLAATATLLAFGERLGMGAGQGMLLRRSRDVTSGGDRNNETVYIYQCTGVIGQYTDKDCESFGNTSGCYFESASDEYRSCAVKCAGMAQHSEGVSTCMDSVSCTKFLQDYCELILQTTPTSTSVSTSVSTSTTKTEGKGIDSRIVSFIIVAISVIVFICLIMLGLWMWRPQWICRRVGSQHMMTSSEAQERTSLPIEDSGGGGRATAAEVYPMLLQPSSPSEEPTPTRGLPLYWDSDTQEEAVKYGTPEFDLLKFKFHETCTTPGIKITEIVRIQDEHLYAKYKNRKSDVEKELADNPSIVVELQLWRGTVAKSIQEILDTRPNRSDGADSIKIFGQGAAFSTTSQYCLDEYDGQGDQYIILEKVVTGRCERGSKTYLGSGHSTFKKLDDQTTIFNVHHVDAAYPEYVIKFQRPDQDTNL